LLDVFLHESCPPRSWLIFDVRQKLRLALPSAAPMFPRMPSESVASLLRLPKRKRLEIAESLWLSVADEEKMPVPPSHKKVLDERWAAYRSGKSKPISHEELMRRLRSK
jgi:putative addiction module component (TIGR02574 family)